MNWLPLVRRICLVLPLFAICVVLLNPVSADTRLTIGSDAPPLAISNWVQKGIDGKAPEITKFEKGKVYVVEFWATWCGPCIQSMPHLAKLQRDFVDRGVQIISVSDEDLTTVEEFLAREAKASDEKPITYQEITKDYSLTVDPDGSTHRDYTAAAKLNGIPVAFIVGKESKIEWIGHPGQMDTPLQQVVDGSWDRKAFAVEYEDEKRFEQLQEMISMRIEASNGKEPSPKVLANVFSAVDKFLAETKTASVAKQARFMQLELLFQFKPNDLATLNAYKGVAKEFERSPLQLNALNYGIYEVGNSGHLTNRDTLKEALARTIPLVDQVPAKQSGTILDTISHLQYLLGDLKSALKTAQQAAAAPDATPDFKKFVTKIQSEITSGSIK